MLLTLHPGRTLVRAQVAGIVHLVSSGVPELDLTDQSGVWTAVKRWMGLGPAREAFGR